MGAARRGLTPRWRYCAVPCQARLRSVVTPMNCKGSPCPQGAAPHRAVTPSDCKESGRPQGAAPHRAVTPTDCKGSDRPQGAAPARQSPRTIAKGAPARRAQLPHRASSRGIAKGASPLCRNANDVFAPEATNSPGEPPAQTHKSRLKRAGFAGVKSLGLTTNVSWLG